MHGALCVCYSGQCLMSSLIGRRSANRGLCAQPCRLPYELVDSTGKVLDTPGAHLLSPKDLAGIAVLPELIGAGVAALKIEGRMKSAEYVALVTGVYRAALDRAAENPDTYQVRDGELAVLGESFSRGFSEAYLVGERGNDMMSYQRPNNRGVPVGRVAATASGRATISLDAPIESRDTIEFWTSAGRFAQPAGPLEYAGSEHPSAPSGVKATVSVERSVTTGDRVFRVRNAALTDAARRTFEEHAVAIPLAFEVGLVVGEPLRVTVTDQRGRSGSAQGALVEPARTKAVTAEEVAEHIGRLGGTPYTVEGWDLTMSPDVGIGFSALHRIRRDALAAYEAGVLEPWSSRAPASPRLEQPTAPRAAKRRRPLLVAVTADAETASACLAAGADRVHVPVEALPRSAQLEPGVVPLLPRIAHDADVPGQLAWCTEGAPVVVGNLGVLAEAAGRGAVVEAHWSLNAVNHSSVAQLAELGAATVWLSPELSGRQIAALAAGSSAVLGTAVWGAQEIMVDRTLRAHGRGAVHPRVRLVRASRVAAVPPRPQGLSLPRAHRRVGQESRLQLGHARPGAVTCRGARLGSGRAATRPSAGAPGAGRQAGQASRRCHRVQRASDIPAEAAAGGPTTSGHFFRGLV